METPHNKLKTGDICVLGAGPAGLACGWAMEKTGNTGYSIFEKSSVHGGNARTVNHNDFLYDTGPHRFHTRNAEATRRISELMGEDLHSVDAPARIFWQGRFVDFPLRPSQILKNGGFLYTLKAARDLAISRTIPSRNDVCDNFSRYARSRFGRTIAETFLIPFSERLWGLPGEELSPDIAGRRLPGFSLLSLLKETFLGSKNSDHLEGRFFYPNRGYGQISDRIAECLDPRKLHYNHRVVGIETKEDYIASLEINTDSEKVIIKPGFVINTLPITAIVNMMNPRPPEEVMRAAAQLKFRDVILVALFIDQPYISDAAVTYFQGSEYEFSRAHEPRNRSLAMSPEGKTSLVVEFPCFRGDDVWSCNPEQLTNRLIKQLDKMGLINGSSVFDSDVLRLENAYPVYFKDYIQVSEIVLSFLRTFKNFSTLGRGGSYFYGHLHDFISEAFDVVSAINQFKSQPQKTHYPN